MNTQPAFTPRRSAVLPWPTSRAASAPAAAREADFALLCHGLQRSGGLLGADQLAGLMRPGAAQPISQLARWIVARQVISLQWRAQTLLPLFQFAPGLASLRPGLAEVLAELGEVFDDWELALWFARGNTSLGGAAPADQLAVHALAVWQAARTDRFIATGG